MQVPARIDGIYAPEGRLAVIFRRGPTKLVQQLVWNLETDEIVRGQWIKGAVYTRRCDVSPDGRYLVGAFTDYSRSHRNHSKHKLRDPWMVCGWTAISRPPYFTAIGLWFSGGAWNGGGIWRSNRHVDLNNFDHCWEQAKPAPKGIKVRDLWLGMSEDEAIYSLLLQKRGWEERRKVMRQLMNPGYKKVARQFIRDVQRGRGLLTSGMDALMMGIESMIPRYELTHDGLWAKPFTAGELIRRVYLNHEVWEVHDASGHARLRFDVPQSSCQFLDVDHRGRVIFGDKGCLWAWSDFPSGEPSLIADLNGEQFEPVVAPAWALEE